MAKNMFYKESYKENIDGIIADRLKGMTVKDLAKKYGGNNPAMHKFITDYEIHRDFIVGIRSTTPIKLSNGEHELDGRPYCIRKRGCPTYVAVHIDEYRKLIGEDND